MFSARQKVALETLVRLVRNGSLSPVQKKLVALLNGKGADGNNSLCRWEPNGENPVNLFARQAMPIVWDWCESTLDTKARGVFLSGVEAACRVIDLSRSASSGQVQLADATHHPLPDQSASVFFTDPPYYDAIPYSDLSDFFLVWLKRTLVDHSFLQDPFDASNPLSPKEREAVQDETKTCDGRVKDREFFEDMMGEAFAEGRRVLRDDGIASVVFAHKTTEGWEALLSGMIRGGWTVTASWPIATESPTRLRARESAALATSVHLICRPRADDAPVEEWAEMLRELPIRVASWMERMQEEGIRGADLMFSCVGPALEIFSRCSAVEKADGQQVELVEYLEKVWEVVGRAALAQVLGKDDVGESLQSAFEADARLAALFLWTHQSSDVAEPDNGRPQEGDSGTGRAAKAKGVTLPFDVVRRFAQPMGIDIDRWTGRIVAQDRGIVRLLPVAERRKQLLGEAGLDETREDKIDPLSRLQGSLFSETDVSLRTDPMPPHRQAMLGRRHELGQEDFTVLDRVHLALLFQAGGHATQLRMLIKAERARGPDFMRLANALSALYPSGNRDKRLLDAMLLAAPH